VCANGHNLTYAADNRSVAEAIVPTVLYHFSDVVALDETSLR
jgi:hypothetical protein